MALRNIRIDDDPVLRKKCKKVTEITPRTHQLIRDMLDTMYEADGVGLAAPQVGILKNIVVIDITENQDNPLVFINPEIIEKKGKQTGDEGCLSVPGKHAQVTRPNYVRVRAQDEEMNWFEMEGEELMARAICHECDHLEGILYIDKKEGPLKSNEE